MVDHSADPAPAPPSARLLRLLSLLQTPHEWSGTELAGRLGVGVRTVRRDVDKLRALGYPVEAAQGVAGYRLGSGARLPPLLLDDDEAVAVAVGLRTAAGGTVSGIEESSVRALAKLEQVLPSRLRRRVSALRAATVSAGSGGPVVDPDALTSIAAACRAHEVLRFDYRGHGGREDVRRTEPHRLVHAAGRWYLLAWDIDRAGWRNFRVDRLRLRLPAGPRFAPREPPEEGPAAHVVRSTTTGVYRYRGRFTLHVPVQVAAERVPPSVGALEAVDEHGCTLLTGSDSLDELALYVGLFGFRFTVHEPPELVAHIRDLAERLAASAAPE
ncbi:helix-turn-helix transcriptional regulator [Nocardiopsis composta]|uniref:Putative DNA-binding transcriptional regulator YafY n=1 Tax=Nocardiopsis composta TaxID=157465 RepID=A0A7W8QNZ6_9ACTN|nr:YafY family protein [Nocardiopsis composta]MBB5433982.1 putative DNA-binding transcriptional regulator YafY [Nocardiopsis composta]